MLLLNKGVAGVHFAGCISSPPLIAGIRLTGLEIALIGTEGLPSFCNLAISRW